jgi:hypothetical protein
MEARKDITTKPHSDGEEEGRVELALEKGNKQNGICAEEREEGKGREGEEGEERGGGGGEFNMSTLGTAGPGK